MKGAKVMKDNDRFERLFSTYSKDIFRLAYSYVLNRHDAEDIVQRTFYKLYKHIKKLSISDAEIKKWLFRVASNESKDILKSPSHKNLKISFDETKEVVQNDDDFTSTLVDVSKNCRIALYLYYYEGYNIKEIAKIIRKSESAVKMRLSRGKEELKMKWRDENEKD